MVSTMSRPRTVVPKVETAPSEMTVPRWSGSPPASEMTIETATAATAFTTNVASDHLRTNAALIQKFVEVDIDCERVDETTWRMVVAS